MYNAYMTTVFRRGRLKISIYREDGGQHHLAHCHVYLLDAEAIFDLKTLECLANSGFHRKTLKQVREILSDYQIEFLDIWRSLNEEE
jgi:Domain of unknown function (DUF4160)